MLIGKIEVIEKVIDKIKLVISGQKRANSPVVLRDIAKLEIKRNLYRLTSLKTDEKCLILAIDENEAALIAKVDIKKAKIEKLNFLDMPQYSILAHMELRALCDVSGIFGVSWAGRKYTLRVVSKNKNWAGGEYFASNKPLDQIEVSKFEKMVLEAKIKEKENTPTILVDNQPDGNADNSIKLDNKVKKNMKNL